MDKVEQLKEFIVDNPNQSNRWYAANNKIVSERTFFRYLKNGMLGAVNGAVNGAVSEPVDDNWLESWSKSLNEKREEPVTLSSHIKVKFIKKQ